MNEIRASDLTRKRGGENVREKKKRKIVVHTCVPCLPLYGSIAGSPSALSLR